MLIGVRSRRRPASRAANPPNNGRATLDAYLHPKWLFLARRSARLNARVLISASLHKLSIGVQV
jgi:hypothetical protein